MKTLGLVGGIGPESTIEYYRFILEGCRARVPDGNAPHLIIDSIDVNRGLALLSANNLTGLAAYLSKSIDRLARAGCDLALIAANTPHIVFDEVQERASIPMLSIVQATCEHASALGLQRFVLLGTGFTMRARFYAEMFARAGLELISPPENDLDFIHAKYVGELLKNKFLPETRSAILEIIERMRREDRIEGVILGGTELPLILRGAESEGLPFLDTTMIHVRAAVDAILA